MLNKINKYFTNHEIIIEKGLTGTRTQVRGFKVLGANHYTMRPKLQNKYAQSGIRTHEPLGQDLKSCVFDHSTIRAVDSIYYIFMNLIESYICINILSLNCFFIKLIIIIY